MANGGGIWAERLNGMLGQTRSPRQTAWLGREMNKLNFSPEEIVERMERGRLSPEDTRRIKWEIVDQTLYVSGKGRQTEFMQSPLGRFVEQFKFWTVNTGRLLKQNVIEEARHGNLAPMARMIVLFPIFGELYADVRSLVRGTSRPSDPGERILEDFFMVGGLALIGDLIQQIQRRDMTGALTWAAGPTVSTLADVGAQAYRGIEAGVTQNAEALRQQMQQTGRWLTQRGLPFIGPWLSQQMRTDPQAKKRAEYTWDQRLGLDPWQRALDHAERLEARKKATMAHVNELAASGQIVAARSVLDSFNAQHGTRLALDPAAVMKRREREMMRTNPRATAVERTRRLSPGVRAILEQGLKEGEYAMPGGRCWRRPRRTSDGKPRR